MKLLQMLTIAILLPVKLIIGLCIICAFCLSVALSRAHRLEIALADEGEDGKTVRKLTQGA